MLDLMRDIQRGVVPDSVKAIMALISKWFAVYMVAMAIASSTYLKCTSRRCLDILALGFFSALRQIRSMAETALSGYFPTAVSCESITASVPSSTAFATSDTSARVGIVL